VLLEIIIILINVGLASGKFNENLLHSSFLPLMLELAKNVLGSNNELESKSDLGKWLYILKSYLRNKTI